MLPIVVDETRDLSIEESLDALIAAATAWQGTKNFEDDVSLLAVEVRG